MYQSVEGNFDLHSLFHLSSCNPFVGVYFEPALKYKQIHYLGAEIKRAVDQNITPTKWKLLSNTNTIRR